MQPPHQAPLTDEAALSAKIPRVVEVRAMFACILVYTNCSPTVGVTMLEHARKYPTKRRTLTPYIHNVRCLF